jgi:hypothetical protein
MLIILELRRPKPKSIEVEQLAGGQVSVNVSTVADRLRYEVNSLPGVLHTRPRITTKKGGVIVELDVEATADINVTESAVPIVSLVQDVVENKLGLRMARPPKVQLRTVGYPKSKKAPTAPRASVVGVRTETTPTPAVNSSAAEEPVTKEIPGDKVSPDLGDAADETALESGRGSEGTSAT